MSTTPIKDSPADTKTILSTIWIFVTLNYLFCDLYSNMEPKVLRELLIGSLGGMHITQGFLLQAAILMEIPIAMILLSRILQYKANRITNIVAGFVMAAVQCLTMFVGTPPTMHYIFYSAIEITTTLFIAGYALRWKADSKV